MINIKNIYSYLFKKIKNIFFVRKWIISLKDKLNYDISLEHLKKIDKLKNNDSYHVSHIKIPREKKYHEDDFLGLLKDISDFFVIKRSNGLTSLCCLNVKNIKISFINEFINIIHRNNFELYIHRPNGFVRLVNIRVLYEQILSQKMIDIRLNDYRSDAVFYFKIEFWENNNEFIMAPCHNHISMKVWKRVLEKYGILIGGKVSYLDEIIDYKHQDECYFDIDFVYTWVNSEDKDWQEIYKQYKPDYINDANSKARYFNRDELKYSLRSVDLYAPWVRKIFIVSNCKPPHWLDLDNERIIWVYHEEIFSIDEIPTFNSHAIETKLHKIRNLSNYFVYFNDDLMLSRPVRKQDFFASNGLCKLKLEPYGNVNADVKEDEPDYLNAARNCQKLIEQEFNVIPTQLHTHSPQAMRKDILNEIENKFQSHFLQTASNKFRTINDISVTSFLFHHYAYCKGLGIKDHKPTLLIHQNNAFKKRYSTLLSEKNKSDFEKRYWSFCINDGANSHENVDWNVETEKFLLKYFLDSCVFEKKR